MGRRFLAGIGLSVLLHVGAAGGVVGVALWHGLPGPGVIDVELTGVKLDDIKDLPLGAPGAPAAAEAAEVVEPPAPRPKKKRKPKAVASIETDGALKARAEAAKKAADEAERSGGEKAAKPGDLKDWGPEGSRLTVLMRLDRLRATPYATSVDDLLALMPDRNGLLEGTGLDLYKDFDALLIATPNPLDYTATFLALRHHLGDKAMREAIDKGAGATGRRIEWRTEGGRPVAERRAKDPAAQDRDNRLILLPAPGLIVVAPPVYAKILLAKKSPAQVSTASPAAPGAPGAVVEGGPAGDAEAGTAVAAGGVVGDKEGGGEKDRRVDWTDLIARIDGQDSALPDNAVVMLSVFDIFTVKSSRDDARVVGATPAGAPGAAASAAAGVAPAPGSAPAAIPAPGGGDDEKAAPLAFGLPLPRSATLTLGALPRPFIDMRSEYAREKDAARIEAAWPEWHAKMKTNPWLVLGGFGPIVDRIEVTREGRIVRAHDTASEAETKRILGMVAGLVRGRRNR